MIKVIWIAVATFFIFSVVSSFIYIDPLNGCFIKLLPSWDFNFNQYRVKEGLIILKNALPDDYKDVCKRIDTIDPNFDCGKSEGGCYWSGNPKRISVSTANSTANWVAAVIIHETCHSKQDSEKRPLNEVECHQEDNRILKNLTVY